MSTRPSSVGGDSPRVTNAKQRSSGDTQS
jgi:hypothetical protein